MAQEMLRITERLRRLALIETNQAFNDGAEALEGLIARLLRDGKLPEKLSRPLLIENAIFEDCAVGPYLSADKIREKMEAEPKHRRLKYMTRLSEIETYGPESVAHLFVGARTLSALLSNEIHTIPRLRAALPQILNFYRISTKSLEEIYKALDEFDWLVGEMNF